MGRYLENSVPQWGAGSSLAGQWLPAAGGDGAWADTTGSGPMRMRGDIFAAARLWSGRLGPVLASRAPSPPATAAAAWRGLGKRPTNQTTYFGKKHKTNRNKALF